MMPVIPVAVTGAGCLCAAGLDFQECAASLFNERRLPIPPTRFTSDHPDTYPVYEVPESAVPKMTFGPIELSLTSVLGVSASVQALKDAGWYSDIISPLRIGVCMGTTVGCTMNNESFYRDFRAGKNPDMAPIKRFLISNPAHAVSRQIHCSGPLLTIVNACCSGTDAIGIGASWIRHGLCDLVIAGGTDELCRVTYNGFISLMITDPDPCRPFDRNRKGLNLGEGAGVVVMESEPIRRSRKKEPRAFVLGYGAASDAYHLTAPKPDGSGLRKAISQALFLSGKRVSDIGFISAHGTGTMDNDRVESRVLHEMMPGVPFFSTKAHTGHTLGAAGAIQAIFTIACLERKHIPKSAGFEAPDPDLWSIPNDRDQPVSSGIALSESLAFGGNNSVLIFQKE